MDEFALLIGQLEAGDGQGDEALLLEVEAVLGAGGENFIEGELGEDGEAGPGVQLDGEGVHRDGVNSAGLGGASYSRTMI